jgi:two-component system response regulator YesN
VGGFNANYLSRLFKQIHNTTVTDYIIKKRMELAKQLLLTTKDKIQDIAEQTGYTSAHSFSRVFRGYAGVSPMEYREIHQHL